MQLQVLRAGAVDHPGLRQDARDTLLFQAFVAVDVEHIHGARQHVEVIGIAAILLAILADLLNRRDDLGRRLKVCQPAIADARAAAQRGV